MRNPNQRTYGGHGRHAIPSTNHGVYFVQGHPDGIRKVLRRNGVAPTFDTLDLDPEYVGRHVLTGDRYQIAMNCAMCVDGLK